MVRQALFDMIEMVKRRAEQLADMRVVDRVEHLIAGPARLDQANAPQAREMMRDRGERHLRDNGQGTDALFALRQRKDYPCARGIAQRGKRLRHKIGLGAF